MTRPTIQRRSSATDLVHYFPKSSPTAYCGMSAEHCHDDLGGRWTCCPTCLAIMNGAANGNAGYHWEASDDDS